MATNMYKKYTESKTREWAVPAGTESNDLVIHAVSGQVGVALTSRGDATAAAGIPGVTGGTIPSGGAGNKATAATVAVDGSWLFEVDGVTDGETVEGTGTAEGTSVFAVVASGVVTSLTTTEGSNTFVGIVDDGAIVDGVAPIQIGAVL